MSEVYSESEVDPNLESEADPNLEENIELRAYIAQLEVDNKSLKDTIQKTIELPLHIEKLNGENRKLKQELQNQRAAYEDLQTRFRLKESQPVKTVTVSPDFGLLNNYAEKEVKLQNDIILLRKELDLVKKSLKEEKNESQKISSTLEKLIDAGSSYFNTDNVTPESLIHILKSKQVITPSTSAKVDTSALTKISKYKQKINQLRQQRQSADLEIFNYKTQIQSLCEEIKERDLIIEKLERNEDDDIPINLELPKLDFKNVPAKKHQIGVQTEYQSDYSRNLVFDDGDNSFMVSPGRKLDDSFQDFGDVELLKEALTHTKVEKNKLTEQSIKLKSKLKEANEQSENTKQKFDSLTRQLKEKETKLLVTNVELEELKRGQVDLKLSLDELQNENSLLKKSIKKIEEFSRQQVQEISIIQGQRNQLLVILNKTLPLIEATPTIVPPSPIQEKPVIKSDMIDFVPDLSLLPGPLAEAIREIPNLVSPKTYIENMLKFISKWIAQKSLTSERERAEFQETLNQYEIQLSEIKSMLPKKTSDVVKGVQLLKDTLDTCQSGSVEKLNQLQEDFNKELSDVSQINKQLMIQNQELKQKLIGEKKILKDTRRAFRFYRDETEEKIDSLTQQVDSGASQVEKLQGMLKDSKVYIHEMAETLQSTRISHAEQYNDAQHKFEQKLHQKDIQIADIQHNFQLALNQKDEELKQLRQTIGEIKARNYQLEQSFNEPDQNGSFQQRDFDFDFIPDKRKSPEKNSINEEINLLKTVLQKKTEASEKLEKEFNALQLRYSTLKKLKAKLQLDVSQAEMKIRSLEEKQATDFKLKDAQHLSILLQHDSDNFAKLEEAKYEYEKKAKQFYFTLAQNFGDFLDFDISYDQSNYPELIERIRREVQKLKQQEADVRKILHAKDGESTHDALVSFILENHPSFTQQSLFK